MLKTVQDTFTQKLQRLLFHKALKTLLNRKFRQGTLAQTLKIQNLTAKASHTKRLDMSAAVLQTVVLHSCF